MQNKTRYLAFLSAVIIAITLCGLWSDGCCEIGTGQDETRGNAVITMIPVLEKGKLAPGDEVRVGLYFTGSGVIGSRKLFYHVPYQIIGKGMVRIGQITYGQSWLSGSVISVPNLSNISIKEDKAQNTGTYVPPDFLFKQVAYERPEEKGLLRIAGEIQRQSNEDQKIYAPFWCAFNLSKDAPPGEHKLFFTLTYESGGAFHVAESAPTIRVLSWPERNKNFLIAIIPILLFIFRIIPKNTWRWKCCLAVLVVLLALGLYFLSKAW